MLATFHLLQLSQLPVHVPGAMIFCPSTWGQGPLKLWAKISPLSCSVIHWIIATKTTQYTNKFLCSGSPGDPKSWLLFSGPFLCQRHSQTKSGGIVKQEECSPRMWEAPGRVLGPQKLGVDICAWNLGTRVVEAGTAQGYPQLPGEVEASLS